MRIKEDCGHGSEDGKAHSEWSEKGEVPPKRLEDLEVQMGVGDVTSPIAVLGITDFGNDWGERARDRISGQRGTSFGK